MDATAYACRAGVLYVFAASCWSPGLLRMAAAAAVCCMSLRRVAGAPDCYVWRRLRRYAVCLRGELLERRTATYGGSCGGTLYVFAASCWSPGLLRMAAAAAVCCMSLRRVAGAPDCFVLRQQRRYAVCLRGELLERRTATYGDSCAGTQYVFVASSWSTGRLRMETAAPVRSMSLRRVPSYRTSAYGGCRDRGTGRQGPAMLSLESLQLPSIKFFRVLFRL